MVIKHDHNKLDYYGSDETHAYYCANGYHERKARLYYRNERTLNDHMGNTLCGYYFNVIWPDGKKQRVYLEEVDYRCR